MSVLECDLCIKGRDEESVLALRSAVFGADHPHTNHVFLDWLFAHSAPGEPTGVLLRLKGEPIGFAALCRKRMWIDGRDQLLAYGHDYMIHPGLRGMVTGRAALEVCIRWLQLATESGCSATLVFPNEQAIGIQTSRHVGLKRLFDPVLLVRPLPGVRVAQRIHRHIPRFATVAALRAAAFASDLRAGLRGAPRGEAVPVAGFGPEFDELWASAVARIEAGVVRDANYLSWRYLHNPVYSYVRLAWRSGGRLRGLMVGSPRQIFGFDALLLVDVVTEECSEDIGAALVAAMVEEGRLRHYDLVAALATPNSALYRLLTGCGFYPVPARIDPKRFHACGTVLDEGAARLWDPDAWYFTWGDIEVV